MSQFETICPFVAFLSIWPSNQCLKKKYSQSRCITYKYPSALKKKKKQKSQPEHWLNILRKNPPYLSYDNITEHIIHKSSGPKQHVPKPHLT